MKIGGKLVGSGCYVIAEAGVNHNGDMAFAKKLVDAAASADADAVKFQTFKAELIVTETAERAEYQKVSAKDESQFTMLKKLELAEQDFAELKQYCAQRGIEFLSTPHSDTWSVDVLQKLGVEAYKVGSGDLTNLPILSYIAKMGRPVIISTGMANIDEVLEAVQTIKDAGNNEIVVLQCTTSYPCLPEDANIRAMETIAKRTGCIVGYSDHTQGIEAPVIAACLGATVIEKHFTLDRSMPGPDHQASLVPNELAKMVRAIRYVCEKGIKNPKQAFNELNQQGFNLDGDQIDVLLGSQVKEPLPGELEIAKVARKSIVALKDIGKGEVLTAENIGIRRPGEGLPPKYIGQFLGKRAARDIKKFAYLQPDSAQRE